MPFSRKLGAMMAVEKGLKDGEKGKGKGKRESLV